MTTSHTAALVSFLSILALACPGPARAARIPNAPTPIGDDFPIDEDRALAPSVATDDKGNFIAVWSADDHMYARQFDRRGRPVTPPFQVDADDPGATAEYPRVVMHAKGDVAYFVYAREVDDEEHVMVRRYLPRARLLDGPPMQMDVDVANASNPNLAIDPRGRSLGVTWSTSDAESIEMPYFRAFTRDGAPLGPPVPLRRRGPHGLTNPAYVTALGAERFMVVWTETGPTDCDVGAFAEIVAQPVDAEGPIGDSFCVAQDSIYRTTGLPVARYMAAAGCRDGSGVIAWTASYPSEYHIFARSYDAHGNLVGDEFRVDDGDPLYEALINRVTCDARGTITHIWLDNPHGGAATAPRLDLELHARSFPKHGSPAAEFRVDAGPAGSVRLPNAGADIQYVPDVAAAASTLIFAWVDWRSDSTPPYPRVFGNVFTKH